MWPGCAQAAFTEADTFTVNFPPVASAGDKAAILAAVIFMDFLYFEKKNNDQNQNNRPMY